MNCMSSRAQRLVAVVGDGHAFVVAQREAGVEHFLAGLEDQRVFRMVFAVDAEGVEQGFHIDRQGELVVLFKDGLDQRIAFAGAAGIEFQQAVAASMQFVLPGARARRGLRRSGLATRRRRPSSSNGSRRGPN